jgi:L,D-transpeptidase YcbB
MAYLRYHCRIRSLLLILFLIGILIPIEALAADTPAQNNQKTLPNRVPSAASSPTPVNGISSLEIQNYTDIQKAILNRLKTGNGSIKSAKGAVPLRERFYSERQFQPAWSRDKAISDQAQKLIQVLKESDREGLNPADYRIDQIEALLAQVKQRYNITNSVTVETWADLDMMLTDAFFAYGTHVSKGRLDPGKWFYQWIPYRRSVDLVQVLTEALDKKDVESSLKSLPPRYPAYAQLRTELANYRRIAADGGWIAIPEKTTLKKGSNGHAVSFLKHRLVISGDLNATDLVLNDHFDSRLQEALQKFQERHGLKANGVMDEETRKALNFSVEKRIRQIEWNMERWRWLPDELGPRYVMVNIPDYRLFVVENQVTVMSMKTVVGKSAQPTPVFMDNMSYLELNPTWNLPNSIVAEEMIPKVKKNPDFLTKKRIRIYSNWSSNAKEIDPNTIDWAKVNPKKFPYRMIQDTGVNPLGRIKFMFPNQFDVYLHDTTQKGLFQRSKRMYSHGCIRVERPYDLGEWVLRDDTSWSKARLLTEIKKGKRQVVNLPKPIPVYVIYLTAWFDTRGHIHFRDDIYDYDKSLEKVLKMSNSPSGKG